MRLNTNSNSIASPTFLTARGTKFHGLQFKAEGQKTLTEVNLPPAGQPCHMCAVWHVRKCMVHYATENPDDSVPN